MWLVLFKCYKSVAESARLDIEASGLGLTDFAVLEALYHKGPLTISAIGAKVLLTSGSMTAAVNRLEAKRLVERVPDFHDRRALQVRLTDEGAKLFQPVFEQHKHALAEAMSSLTRPERGELVRLLKKLGISARTALEERAGASGSLSS